MLRWLALLLLVGAGSVGWTVAKEQGADVPRSPDAKGIEFYEKKIRPVLVEQCYSCHNQEKNKKKGNLTLDTRAGHLKGGDTGSAVVPGKPAESLLIKAIKYTDADLKMPPKETARLTAAETAALKAWIDAGAKGPSGAGPDPTLLVTPVRRRAGGGRGMPPPDKPTSSSPSCGERSSCARSSWLRATWSRRPSWPARPWVHRRPPCCRRSER